MRIKFRHNGHTLTQTKVEKKRNREVEQEVERTLMTTTKHNNNGTRVISPERFAKNRNSRTKKKLTHTCVQTK